MFCDQCGTELQVSQGFCSRCGKAIRGPVSFAAPRSGRVAAHIRLLGILCLAGALCAGRGWWCRRISSRQCIVFPMGSRKSPDVPASSHERCRNLLDREGGGRISCRMGITQPSALGAYAGDHPGSDLSFLPHSFWNSAWGLHALGTITSAFGRRI
jgi:hypothetical protein